MDTLEQRVSKGNGTVSVGTRRLRASDSVGLLFFQLHAILWEFVAKNRRNGQNARSIRIYLSQTVAKNIGTQRSPAPQSMAKHHQWLDMHKTEDSCKLYRFSLNL